MEMRRKFCERLFCFEERIVFGEARRQLQKKEVAEMNACRNNFFVRFGAGQPYALMKERNVIGLACLANMEDKLD